MSNRGEAAETRANKHSSQNGDDIYYIFNKKYGTGVKVPEDADRAALVGCRQTKDDHQGYRWILERYRNSTGYKIRSADLEWSVVRDHAHPDFIQTGKKGHWWIIKPTSRDENCYLISPIEGGGYWGLDEGSDGTTIKLRDSTGDDANLWQFESVSAIAPKIPSMHSAGASNSFKSRPASRNKSHSATIWPPGAYQTPGVKTCPVPTPVFTGRRDTLEQIKACISHGDRERCVFVLHGLGGAGKTQLALKTVQDTWDMWTDILFVDATSRETATRALEAFAKDRRVGQTHHDTIQWLGNQRERWLMVFDNADDPSVRISDFFPGGNHGSIVITTRIPGMDILARGPSSDFGVSSMEPGEALELLLRTAKMQENALEEAEHNAANELLESFGYLALAIVQAGAYIRCSERTIRQYHDMFVKQRRVTLERYAEVLIKVDNYRESVYTTWLLSYKRLSTHSQRLLHIVAFMHRSDITEDIFRRAAVSLPKYEPVIPATGDEAKVRTYAMEFLQPYLNSAGAWDSGVFLKTMTELTSYSLMSYDCASGAYTMHVLVHDWASTVTNHPLEVAVQHTALLLAVSIDYGDTVESLAYKRGVEVHVNRVLERQPRPSVNNATRFAEVYGRAGKWKQRQKLVEVVVEGSRKALGDEHPVTLDSMHNLALAYQGQGRYKEAEELLSQVIASRKRLSGEEHPSTLTSMSQLAYTYIFLGRYEEALSLQTKVANTRERALGGGGTGALRSIEGFVSTYRAQGLYGEAEGLLVQVIEAKKRLHGEEHPETLSSIHELALIYQQQGQLGQAEVLQVQVLSTTKQASGEEHPDTLTSMHALASTYYLQCRYEQAELLLVQVVKARKRVSGDEHPETLTSMGDLALTYSGQGRYEQAEALQVQVLNANERVHGGDHPATLTTMLNLASVHWKQGRHEQAEGLQAYVVDVRKRVLNPRHPHTLLAMRHLAATYRSLGRQRQRQYEKLQGEISQLEALSQ